MGYQGSSRVRIPPPRHFLSQIMRKVSIKCSYCNKEFQREQGRYNEAKKEGWNQYCSLKCQKKAKLRRAEKVCGNPECNKAVSRLLNQFKKSKSGLIFCSLSCAAIVTNAKFPRKKAKRKICNYCGKEFTGDGTRYCSKKCKDADQVINEETILEQIKEFFRQSRRIPVKRESAHYNAARDRFGSWNNAIKAAGFNPNPVKFANKHIANDGHKCDSLSEKIIDDWLYAKKISHEINTPYGKNRMTADFRVNNILIEFLGLQGELKEYDKSLTEKRKLWEQKKIKIIKIYPKDLFPKSKLDSLLSCLL